MIRSVLKILLSLMALCSLTAQNVKIEGVRNLLAKEEKFDNLTLYLTLGKPTALKIYASANSKILLYKDNPLQAETVNSATYDTQDKCWQIFNPQTSCGYLVQEKEQLNHYIYVLDYKDYAFEPQNLQVREQELDPCRRIVLSWSGGVKSMLYYGSTAVPKKLEREIELSYKNLKYSDKEHKFLPEEVMEKVEVEGNSYEMTASLSDTPYTFVQDKWQKAFALQMPNVSSPIYTSNRLEVHSLVRILDEEGTEVPKDDWSLLSAPVNLELKTLGNKSDEQRFRWQIKQRENGDKEGRVILDYTGQETDYTLDEAGYYEVSMVAFGANGTCSDNSFIQELRVQESKLEVPNAFTPFDSQGVNDVFRVYAKSLVSFEGHIFAQNGQKLYSWYNVDGGWDGSYRGKEMPMGAYYYVIKARGADGIEYNQKGVVNLVRTDGFNTMNNSGVSPRQ